MANFNAEISTFLISKFSKRERISQNEKAGSSRFALRTRPLTNDVAKKHSVYLITYDISKHRSGWENRQKFYDYIDDQDFCPISDSSCLMSTTMTAKELMSVLMGYLHSGNITLLVARIEAECEISSQSDDQDSVKMWLKEHSL